MTRQSSPVRLASLAVAAGLLGFGLWQLGGAAWIHGKAMLAQILLEQAWAVRLDGADENQTRPWPWADTAPIARIRVPRLGIDQIILAGASGRTLAFGPAHLSGTAPPGTTGHSIISGHRDTHFAFLRDLQPGDTVEIQRADGDVVRYQVTSRGIVDARTAQFTETPERGVASLVTCYPFEAVTTNGPLRYVVTAEATGKTGPAMETSILVE